MQTNVAQAILDVIIFWLLTTPHEFAHAWVADRLGDDTPRLEGRVTLNPLAHVDWMGTVLVPLLSSLFGGVFFGWGKAVNTNPARLRGGYNGLVAVAVAGPASNVVFAGLLALIGSFWPAGTEMLFRAAYISLFLALFNMIPIPPLDGSKFLLAARIPVAAYIELSRFGFLLLMVLMYSTGIGRWMSEASYMGALQMFRLFHV
ncbi:MAG: site-2 protease family protein [Candidatus Solibacter usitatus]|nr:site-2 protease family protein [Candidatus Solibacter usitatus]